MLNNNAQRPNGIAAGDAPAIRLPAGSITPTLPPALPDTALSVQQRPELSPAAKDRTIDRAEVSAVLERRAKEIANWENLPAERKAAVATELATAVRRHSGTATVEVDFDARRKEPEAIRITMRDPNGKELSTDRLSVVWGPDSNGRRGFVSANFPYDERPPENLPPRTDDPRRNDADVTQSERRTLEALKGVLEKHEKALANWNNFAADKPEALAKELCSALGVAPGDGAEYRAVVDKRGRDYDITVERIGNNGVTSTYLIVRTSQNDFSDTSVVPSARFSADKRNVDAGGKPGTPLGQSLLAGDFPAFLQATNNGGNIGQRERSALSAVLIRGGADSAEAKGSDIFLTGPHAARALESFFASATATAAAKGTAPQRDGNKIFLRDGDRLLVLQSGADGKVEALGIFVDNKPVLSVFVRPGR